LKTTKILKFIGRTYERSGYGFLYNKAYSLSGDDLAVMDCSNGDDDPLVRVQCLKMKYYDGVYYDSRALDHYILNSFKGGENEIFPSIRLCISLNLTETGSICLKKIGSLMAVVTSGMSSRSTRLLNLGMGIRQLESYTR
jgi:hypothetical protein